MRCKSGSGVDSKCRRKGEGEGGGAFVCIYTVKGLNGRHPTSASVVDEGYVELETPTGLSGPGVSPCAGNRMTQVDLYRTLCLRYLSGYPHEALPGKRRLENFIIAWCTEY